MDYKNFAGTICPEAEVVNVADAMKVKLKGTALDTQESIVLVCDNIKALLIEKNKRYGDSALHPKQIFNKLSPSESISVRLDDKLSRIINSEELRKNDVADVIGYLVLLCISQGWTNFSDQID